MLGGGDLRFVTLATPDFRGILDRLLRSLDRSHPAAEVEVYVDEPAQFDALPNRMARCLPLTSIVEHGPKRAKLDLYCDAISRGPFVYLDADVVVLDRLDHLVGDEFMAACPDDLSACPFIADRSHPWPGAPELRNRRYFNSGVMSFGTGMVEYFADVRDRVESEDFWDRHIHPDGLFDNHVLCAYLNLIDVPVREISSRAFNWQGVWRADGSICATSDGERIVNVDTGERVRLVHFAGIRDVDRHLLDMPLDLSRAINRASLVPTAATRACCQIAAGAQPVDRYDDPHRAATARVMSVACADAWQPGTWAEDRYVSRPSDVVSVALAVPPSIMRWNGLACGGAYLEPSEYVFLRSTVLEAEPTSVVEFGAGETTRMLADLVPQVVSLEPFDGPWMQRAVVSDARVVLAPLDNAGRFHPTLLSDQLPSPIDMLFVDSPRGVDARRVLLDQLLEFARPTRIVIHDARRDLATLAGALVGHDYVIEATLDTHRGVAVLRAVEAPPLGTPRPVASVALIEHLGSLDRLDPGGIDVSPSASTAGRTHIRVTNRSSVWWPCGGQHPVRIGYHIIVDGKVMLHDGRRTELPADVGPGDFVDLDVTIVVPISLDRGVAAISLVQEGVVWFDEIDPEHATCVELSGERGSSSLT